MLCRYIMYNQRNEKLNARQSLEGLRSTDDWWDWCLTTLLDGLHLGGPSAAAAAATQGTQDAPCSALAELNQTQGDFWETWGAEMEESSSPPRPFSALLEDSPPTCSPANGGFENQNVTPGGPRVWGLRKEDFVLSLGRTRSVRVRSQHSSEPAGQLLAQTPLDVPICTGAAGSRGRHSTFMACTEDEEQTPPTLWPDLWPEAQAALTALRASRWINHSTRAVSVHFTLYNPPTRLFTSVTMSAEVLPTGDLVPSSLIESFRIFRGDSALWYSLVLPELSVIGVTLTYYTASSHLTTLAGDVTDQFHKGFCQVSVDLSLMALWNQ
ncbi:Hypothetical predicted protein, partial [Marmota monax]